MRYVFNLHQICMTLDAEIKAVLVHFAKIT